MNIRIRYFFHILAALLTIFLAFAPLIASAEPIRACAIQNNTLLAESDSGINFWDIQTGKLVDNVNYSIGSVFNFVVNDKKFYFASSNGFYIYDSILKSWQNFTELNSQINSLAIEPSRKLIFLALDNRQVIEYDISRNNFTALGEHSGPVLDITVSGSRVYSISTAGEIKSWDLEQNALERNITPAGKGFGYWRITANNEKIYFGGAGGNITILDAGTGSIIKEIPVFIYDVKALLSDSRYLYASGVGTAADQRVKIWNLNGEKQPTEIDVKALGYSPLNLNSDDKYLCVALIEGATLIYDKQGWNLVKTLGTPAAVNTEQGIMNFRNQIQKQVRPVMPIFVVCLVFFVIVLLFDIFSTAKKQHGKVSKENLAKAVKSYVSVNDLFKLLGIASLLILIVGLINPKIVFPYFLPHLKLIYYFDALIIRGGLLSVWFVFWPALGYWLLRKSQKKSVKWLFAFIGLLFAAAVYLLAPRIF